MNNILLLHKIRKAALLGCLFLCVLQPAFTQEWQFDQKTAHAYSYVLNLQTDEAHALIPEPATPQETYVVSLAEAIELLITEDATQYAEFEQHFEERVSRKIKRNDADALFLQAEIYLQWAFVYLKFGHEFDAALNFRQAYIVTQEIRKRYPKYQAILKTAGLLDVIIGAIPEKYNWVLTLLNMEGTVSLGLETFQKITSSGHPFAFEAGLWHAFTLGFVLQQPKAGIQEVEKLLQRKPANRMALFLGANLHLKNSANEKALTMLESIERQEGGMPIYYIQYLKGEIYLHKAAYLNATSAYRFFINQYKGQNYIKDAYYKIGLCYWLNGNKNDAYALFQEARRMGKEATEPDKYAARSLAESQLPHVALTKVRYFTDGGYYEEAAKIVDNIDPLSLNNKRNEVEYHYRKARLAHKVDDLAKARALYAQTIAINGTENWYFAPNACLQLGYLAMHENDAVNAKLYFTRALSYKKHEYKNSIDSKARAALAQLKKAK